MPFRTLAITDQGKRLLRFIEAWSVALALALGGAVAGYAFSEYRLTVIVSQVNAQHQAEAKRLQETNQRVLAALADRVQSAAQKVDIAGAKAATAADQSAQAAQSAKSAVAEVQHARPVIRPVIVAPPPAAAVPEPVRANLNRAIERTNRTIKDKERQRK
ncbi:hypothetical protein B0G84_5758 [Paraburkholderia sp. BL8N3]|nr:hypothetical protein [Paraburkholderia sp. BL8N3]TCK36745.1 hypothetical protein B0G84_5758 [Paraburkholderia sp. BL8N3]